MRGRSGRRCTIVLRAGLLTVVTTRMFAGGASVPGPDGTTALTAELEGVNRPPVATDDKASVDAEATIDDRAPGLLFNDVDLDGDALVAIPGSAPTHGTATVRRDGSWVYTPSPGFAGSDSFTYRVTDGLVTSSPATVRITVRGPAVPTSPTPSRSASPTASPAPSLSPSPTATPDAMPGAVASPPIRPDADGAFWIPDPVGDGPDVDRIALEASAVAGLGPVLWTVPSLLIALPGLLLVLAMVVRTTRRSRLVVARGDRTPQVEAATRS